MKMPRIGVLDAQHTTITQAEIIPVAAQTFLLGVNLKTTNRGISELQKQPARIGWENAP